MGLMVTAPALFTVAQRAAERHLKTNATVGVTQLKFIHLVFGR
jgi:hypothetical protein